VSRTKRKKKSLLSATPPISHEFQTKTGKQKPLPNANPSAGWDICPADGGHLQKQNPRRSSSERREAGGSKGESLGFLLGYFLENAKKQHKKATRSARSSMRVCRGTKQKVSPCAMPPLFSQISNKNVKAKILAKCKPICGVGYMPRRWRTFAKAKSPPFIVRTAGDRGFQGGKPWFPSWLLLGKHQEVA